MLTPFFRLTQDAESLTIISEFFVPSFFKALKTVEINILRIKLFFANKCVIKWLKIIFYIILIIIPNLELINPLKIKN
jgi:hypothetical protein